jgi:hypothetical protein
MSLRRRAEEKVRSAVTVMGFLQGELFRGAYSGLRTKAVQMEERNVYCGLFSVTTLLEKSVFFFSDS